MKNQKIELNKEIQLLNMSIKSIEEKIIRLEALLNIKLYETPVKDNAANEINSEKLNDFEKVKQILKNNVHEVAYKTWIEPIQLINITNEYIHLNVPSTFHKEIFIEKYLNEFKNIISTISGKCYVIIFDVLNSSDYLGIYDDDEDAKKIIDYKDPLFYTKYLFDTIIVGNHNELAYKISLEFAKQLNGKNKLLYIYGEEGLGKSHLLHAIGNYMVKTNNPKKVTYITMYNFINEILTSVLRTKEESFYKKVYDSDVLIFDDFESLIGKEKSQEEFSKIVKYMLNNNKSVIIASKKPQDEILINGETFDSVFEISSAAEITKPDLYSRVEILKERVKSENLIIDDKTLNIIAQNIDSNVVKLLNQLNRVASFYKMTNKSLTENEILNLIL